MATALQAYYTEIGNYPATLSLLATNSTYIPAVPTPPTGTTQTVYTYTPGTAPANTFALCAVMETQAAATPQWKVSTLNAGGYQDTEAAGTCVTE
ncbi:MAG: hypothetical protein Q7S14_03030 [bacterium]|nr:hypothetical protein [bacterium]